MIVPTFNNTRRSLLSIDQINVSRDILNIKFLLKSDQDPSKISYSLSIQKWMKDHLHLKIKFDDPNVISKGMNRDTVYMKMKNP